MSGSSPPRSRSVPPAAALGFRSHSGWAVLIAVARQAGDPVVALRRRVVLSQQTPRQPFHAAEGQPFATAENLIRASTDEATALADQAVGEAIAELRAAGHAPVAGSLLLGSSRPLPGLREILASHALIHAAEGALFRDVLRKAIAHHGLRVAEVTERELPERASRVLRHSAPGLTRRLAEWGKVLGPPWTQDEKRAALVAWLALVE